MNYFKDSKDIYPESSMNTKIAEEYKEKDQKERRNSEEME